MQREQENNISITLNFEDATLKNKQGDGHQEPKPEPTAALEIIIQEINNQYAINLSDGDKVIKEVYQTLKEDQALISTLRANNIEDVKKIKLRESIDDALLKNAEPPLEFLNRLSKDRGLANYVVSQFFQLLMNDIKDDAA